MSINEILNQASGLWNELLSESKKNPLFPLFLILIPASLILLAVFIPKLIRQTDTPAARTARDFAARENTPAENPAVKDYYLFTGSLPGEIPPRVARVIPRAPDISDQEEILVNAVKSNKLFIYQKDPSVEKEIMAELEN
ncbi:MAG: hypothetical protein A2096_09820 [Spirochaetes bacterium GWF1_41_5]|nr:MAG: hypothetical protein A2096_09820 [Spirochaetes bacterium GWF1_41_5]HBE03784.1 hypothetical protein [Spirochaetia bacterium]